MLTATGVGRGGEQLPGRRHRSPVHAGQTVLIPELSSPSRRARPRGARPGGRVHVTVTDTGQTSYTGAVVTTSFAEMFDDAGYDNNASATAGAVSYAALT